VHSTQFIEDKVWSVFLSKLLVLKLESTWQLKVLILDFDPSFGQKLVLLVILRDKSFNRLSLLF